MPLVAIIELLRAFLKALSKNISLVCRRSRSCAGEDVALSVVDDEEAGFEILPDAFRDSPNNLRIRSRGMPDI